MIKETFIPNCYKDKKNELKNKRIKICIMVILVINIFLLCLIINIFNKTNKTAGVISNKSSNVTSLELGINDKHDLINVNKYKEVSDFFIENKLSYQNINITKGNLEIDLEVKSSEELIVVLRCIEKSYSIKKLVPNNKNERKFNFKVILEV